MTVFLIEDTAFGLLLDGALFSGAANTALAVVRIGRVFGDDA
jgi:hypothetical protein